MVVQHAKIPPDKVLNTIQMYGNTTAATVPITIDHWRREGKVNKGDRILANVFASGYTRGALRRSKSSHHPSKHTSIY